MLTESDREWLAISHPGLIPDGQGVSGTIVFEAVYNRETNRFFVLGDIAVGEIKGTVLSGSFRIRIEERTRIVHSELPAVYIDGVEPTIERHFNQQDKSACLCSPLNEDEYLQPQLEFKKFITELVIPFLYGQVFFTHEQRWPWTEWGHGTIGILESYELSANRQMVEKCLKLLRRDLSLWRRILRALQQKAHLKGNMLCFCGRKVRIKMCHKRALTGAIKLRKDMRTLGIVLQ